MNKFLGIGFVTNKPSLEQTNSGTAYTRFTIAIDRNYRDNNGEKITDFLNIVAWRGLAETCAKYLDKGRQVAIVGTLNTRSYTPQDGVKRFITEIVADSVQFLGATVKTAQNQNNGVKTENEVEMQQKERKRSLIDELQEIEDSESDLPF